MTNRLRPIQLDNETYLLLVNRKAELITQGIENVSYKSIIKEALSK